MTIPRLSPDGVGRGCFVLCLAFCGPIYGVLWYWNIGTLQDNKTALRACKWSLRRFCFLRSVPPCWTQAQKCRLETIGGHASSGKLLGSVGIWADTLEGLEGKKARPIAGRVVSKLASGAADASIGKEKRAYLVSALFLPY